MLQIFAQIRGAKNILEIGTLGGYSTIWMARALPKSGRLITLEADPKHAEVARSNISCAGLSGIVDLRIGRAIDTLPSLEMFAPFDIIFIDADKPSNPEYLKWALKYSKPGTLIIGDNVVRDGEVANPKSNDPRVQGTRKLVELMGADKRLNSTAIQTVGTKGYDGFAMAVVNE